MSKSNTNIRVVVLIAFLLAVLIFLYIYRVSQKPIWLEPTEKLASKAETMEMKDLQKITRKIVMEIAARKGKLESVEKRVADLRRQNPASQEALELDQKEAGPTRYEVNQMAIRYHIYAAKIEKLGGRAPKLVDLEKH